MGRSLKFLTWRPALCLCAALPFLLVKGASPNPGTPPTFRSLSLRLPTTQTPDWTHLDDELPLIAQAEAAEVELLAYQVTIAAAAANCREPVGALGIAPSAADLLARRIYDRLSCSPAPLAPTHRSWAVLRRSRPIKELAPPPQPLPEIEAAIELGAAVTGVSPDYLRRTAMAESGLRPTVSAEASSARGLYQFLASTWLATVRRYGSELGLSRAASAIDIDASGHAGVRDPDARAAILALRADPLVSTAVAGMLTRENAAQLAASGLGAVDAGRLYAAHVLGAHGAAVLYGRLLHRPQDQAGRSFTAAADSNPALFHAHGHLLSVSGLVQMLQRKVGD